MPTLIHSPIHWFAYSIHHRSLVQLHVFIHLRSKFFVSKEENSSLWVGSHRKVATMLLSFLNSFIDCSVLLSSGYVAAHKSKKGAKKQAHGQPTNVVLARSTGPKLTETTPGEPLTVSVDQ